jgi:hypothetical protein
MSRLLVLVLLMLPVVAFGGDRHKKELKLPVSRWREVKRLKPDSSVVTFTDTLYVQFRRKDSFSYHNRNGFIYNGGYTINEDSILDFGTAKYKIEQKRPTSLILSNETGIFYLEPDLSDTAVVIVIKKDEKWLPVTNIDQMIGHWTVYKRVAKEQDGGAIDNTTTIRAIFITGPSTDGKQGYVFSGSDPGNDPSWYIKSLGTDQSLDCNGKSLRNFKVDKCQDGEMIIEENDIKYYLKQFK